MLEPLHSVFAATGSWRNPWHSAFRWMCPQTILAAGLLIWRTVSPYLSVFYTLKSVFLWPLCVVGRVAVDPTLWTREVGLRFHELHIQTSGLLRCFPRGTTVPPHCLVLPSIASHAAFYTQYVKTFIIGWLCFFTCWGDRCLSFHIICLES